MKTIQSKMHNLKSFGTKASAMAVLSLLAIPGFSQDPGGSPDGPPPAVPFTDYLHLIIIGVGAAFALYTLSKRQAAVKKALSEK